MRDYREIYLHNRYEVSLSSTSSFTFSLEKLSYHTIFDRDFAIITAYNPKNVRLSDDANSQRDQQLYNDLYSAETLLAVGCYEGHCEKGYLIFEIDLEKALALGRKYEQYAIFYCDRSCLKYVECDTQKVIVEKRIDPKGSEC